MRYSKTIIITGCFITLSVIFNACQKNLLDKYPLDEVTSSDFFLQTNDLKVYMNQFYNGSLLPILNGPILANNYRGGADDYNSDNAINGIVMQSRLQGTRTINWSGDLVGWNFSDVRSINYFFDNYKRCQSKFDDYKQYVGEAHFFRALIYFQFLQTFGDVPWLSTNLGTTSPELYAPRTARNLVADNIIADLDSAALYLSTDKGDGSSRINKWMALLIQSRVALYEGTWEKYHANDAFGVSNSQPEKYFNKVVESASTIMSSGLYNIYAKGNPSSDYADLFIQRDYSTNEEVLFWRRFSTALSIDNNKNYITELPSSRTLTKSLADAYLCSDGKPISGNPLFGGTDSISNEMKNRDPRFYQTIFTPDAVWEIDPTSGTIYWRVVYNTLGTDGLHNAPTGYVQRKGYDPQMIYHSLNYEETPSIYYRFAEVLLNFAEAKAELGVITQDDINNSIKKLRDRVGMPNLNLSSITTDPMWDFPNLSPTINEIRRERRIELASEGFRWPDIARWAAADKLIVGKRPKGFKQSQLKTTTYPVDSNGFLDPLKASIPNGYGFVIGRDYLNPIPLNEILFNPKLTQNPGWKE